MYPIIVADDHPVIRWGVVSVLKNKVHFDGGILEADSGSGVIDAIKKNKLELVITDLSMPNTDAQGMLKTLLAIQPDVKVLVFSVNKEELFGPLFLRLGAKGYVAKDIEQDILTTAIKTVLAGGTYIRPEMKGFYKNALSANSPYDSLTARETELLCQIVAGASVAQIAKIFSVGITTISTHKANLFKKLHVNNIVELKNLVALYPLQNS